MKGYKPDGFIENLFNEAKQKMHNAVHSGINYEYYKGQFLILRQILDPKYGPCKEEHSVTMRMKDNYCVDCGIDIPDPLDIEIREFSQKRGSII